MEISANLSTYVSINVLESVLEKLKWDLKDNKKEAAKFINGCFGEMLDDKVSLDG